MEPTKKVILPGNLFTKPSNTTWYKLAGGMRILYVEPTMMAWRLFVLVCFGLFIVGVGVVSGRKHLVRVVSNSFGPGDSFILVLKLCGKYMLGMSGIMLPVVVLYRLNANWFQCGDSLSKYTTSVLYWEGDTGDAAQVVLALLMGLYSATSAMFLVQFRSVIPWRATQISTKRKTLVIAVWMFVSVILALPTLAYGIVSGSLTEDNVIGISASSIQFIQYAAPVLLAVINTIIAPLLAYQLDSTIGAELVEFTRLLTSVVVPIIGIVLMDGGCMGGWSVLWKRCRDDPTAFDITLKLKFAAASPIPLQILRHNDICRPSDTINAGRCARSIVRILGQLLSQKLLLISFAQPLWHIVWHCRLRKLLFKQQSQRSKSLELVPVSSLMSYAVMLGLFVPVVVPVVCCTFGLMLVAHRWLIDRAALGHVTGGLVFRWEFVGVSIVLSQAFSLILYTSNSWTGSWLLWSVYGVVDLMLLLQMLRKCREHNNNTGSELSIQHNKHKKSPPLL